MRKMVLVLIGVLASALAVAGALLPGLPATPFAMLALWAFSRSSPRLHAALSRMPLLRSAVDEAHRFETRRSVRPQVKLVALGFAWGSTALAWTLLRSGSLVTPLLVTAAAIAATMFMLAVPTDRS